MNFMKLKPRFDTRAQFDTFKLGKLVPVHAEKLETGESGVLSQNIRLELAPIPGRLITPIHAEVHVVYVPAQAIDAVHDPEADYVGVTEVMKQRYMTENPLYDLEEEGEISMRCDVEPTPIGGDLMVCPSVRYAYIAAVNRLRLGLYNKATLLDNTVTSIVPALLSSTILQRLDGVLDPDDRINGQIAFDLPEANLRIKGIGAAAGAANSTSVAVTETGGGAQTYAAARWLGTTSPNNLFAEMEAGTNVPKIFAEFAGVQSEGISFTDFYAAQSKDRFVRMMDEMIKANPEYGEEMVLRAVHGLTVDTGKTPMVLHHEKRTFGGGVAKATDKVGIQNDTMRSDALVDLSYTIPIPRTELGGVVITLVTVKPDEVIPNQPHPLMAREWVARNFVADELQLDPVPVTKRMLDNNILSVEENDVAFYTGLNALARNYQSYGISRRLDPELISNKMLIYQLRIPMSVTPDNINYPEDFQQHIFADPTAEVVACFKQSAFRGTTPIVFGPTPRETVEIIDAEDIFEETEE
ncbi:hypothetical protein [Pararhodobacter sp.]|uniref:hypothetical protein n=1 Tax=Pararhodobacter sp. TaxID=2127056 RepID=UPI002FE1F020